MWKHKENNQSALMNETKKTVHLQL
jgi:hypothetical protein